MRAIRGGIREEGQPAMIMNPPPSRRTIWLKQAGEPKFPFAHSRPAANRFPTPPMMPPF